MDKLEHLQYLEKINFSKRLKNLEKKYKNKKIIIYGTGQFFQVINENYDLGGLDIIAIADRKFYEHKEDETFLGYKVCSPDEMVKLKPDCVLVATLNTVNLIEELEYTVLKKSKIKLKPLINKPLFDIWKEIWG